MSNAYHTCHVYPKSTLLSVLGEKFELREVPVRYETEDGNWKEKRCVIVRKNSVETNKPTPKIKLIVANIQTFMSDRVVCFDDDTTYQLYPDNLTCYDNQTMNNVVPRCSTNFLVSPPFKLMFNGIPAERDINEWLIFNGMTEGQLRALVTTYEADVLYAYDNVTRVIPDKDGIPALWGENETVYLRSSEIDKVVNAITEPQLKCRILSLLSSHCRIVSDEDVDRFKNGTYYYRYDYIEKKSKN